MAEEKGQRYVIEMRIPVCFELYATSETEACELAKKMTLADAAAGSWSIWKGENEIESITQI